MQKSQFFATNTNTLWDNIFERFLSLQVGGGGIRSFLEKGNGTQCEKR